MTCKQLKLAVGWQWYLMSSVARPCGTFSMRLFFKKAQTCNIYFRIKSN